MVAFWSKKKKEEFVEDDTNDYISVEHNESKDVDETAKSVEVKVFVLDDYENIRDVLDVIRGEKTMCLIDIHLLRNKDPEELKRAIDKLKKTVEATGGELVGFHENWILSAPKNVQVHKGKN